MELPNFNLALHGNDVSGSSLSLDGGAIGTDTCVLMTDPSWSIEGVVCGTFGSAPAPVTSPTV